MPNSQQIQAALADNKTLKYLRSLSICAGLACFAIGSIYAFADENLVRRPLPPGQTSIVVWIEELGPIWPFLFFFSGLTLIISAIVHRGVILSHGCGFFVWAFYGGAILFGAIRSVPPAPILMGTVSCFIAAAMWIIAKIWASEGVK